MNSEIAKKWVTALRTKKINGAPISQAKGALHPTAYGYCCLGVLCELYRLENGGEWDYMSDYVTFLGEADLLPSKVRDWAGLTLNSPRFGSGESLAYMNDQGKSFDDIADLIEANNESKD